MSGAIKHDFSAPLLPCHVSSAFFLTNKTRKLMKRRALIFWAIFRTFLWSFHIAIIQDTHKKMVQKFLGHIVVFFFDFGVRCVVFCCRLIVLVLWFVYMFVFSFHSFIHSFFFWWIWFTAMKCKTILIRILSAGRRLATRGMVKDSKLNNENVS